MKHPGTHRGVVAAILSLVLCSIHAGGPTLADEPVPVLLELFTSQGCSSCPAADGLLTLLEEQQPVAGARIIVLSEHVDYWNDLGWVDPFSSVDFTRRQSAYAQHFHRDSVYTPQLVVDGTAELVGNDRTAALQAIERAAGQHKARVVLRRAAGGRDRTIRLQIEIRGLEQIEHSGTIDVILAVTETNLTSDVRSGENAGQQLKHVGVARFLMPIDEIRGSPERVVIEAPAVRVLRSWKTYDLLAVVFLQDRRSRRILGAATLPTHP